MESTGFNGDPVPEERLAVGYGSLSDGKINAPPYWGETSWLVLGSGGMVSTTGDMLRWMKAIRSGDILTPETQRLYWGPSGGILEPTLGETAGAGTAPENQEEDAPHRKSENS